jgi:hypothetical protein
VASIRMTRKCKLWANLPLNWVLKYLKIGVQKNNALFELQDVTFMEKNLLRKLHTNMHMK